VGQFLAGHFVLVVGPLTAMLWIGALGWYIGPEMWRHWQSRHARWFGRE